MLLRFPGSTYNPTSFHEWLETHSVSETNATSERARLIHSMDQAMLDDRRDSLSPLFIANDEMREREVDYMTRDIFQMVRCQILV
jgi:hypothetical protein